MKTTIDVTAEDIAGFAEEYSTPILAAGRRKLGKILRTVSGRHLILGYPAEGRDDPRIVDAGGPREQTERLLIVEVELPPQVAYDLGWFFKDGKMEPFSFEVDIPDDPWDHP